MPMSEPSIGARVAAEWIHEPFDPYASARLKSSRVENRAKLAGLVDRHVAELQAEVTRLRALLADAGRYIYHRTDAPGFIYMKREIEAALSMTLNQIPARVAPDAALDEVARIKAKEAK